jgi:conjugal transfer pilus assembly protein TrbC
LFPQDEEISEPDKKDQLLVFVSFSMPEASLKSLAQAAEQHNAVLITRGLYEDSFVKTANKLKDLGIGVDINPELFETYQIDAVPTFVCVKSGRPLWRLKGNVTLGFVTKKFKGQRPEEEEERRS